MRRLLGPVGGPIVFFLVAALVFAGLGWVTYAALGVEQAQREAHARAEVGYNLRVAVRQLDTRMLPVLGVEDSRPFYHYAPNDPASTPLLATNLPDWMTLHFQVDPTNGWVSPQVLEDAGVAERVRRAWPADLPLRNLNGSRVDFLKSDLQVKFPPQPTCELFAQLDQSTSADSPPFAAPLYVGEVNQPAPSQTPPITDPQTPGDPNPKPTPPSEPISGLPNLPNISPDPRAETLHVLGFDLCLRCEQAAGNQYLLNNSTDPLGQQKKFDQNQVAQGQAPPPRSANTGNLNTSPRGGGRSQKDLENDPGWLDFRSRVGTITKGVQDARNAADVGRGPYSQNPGLPQMPGDPKSGGGGGMNYAQPMLPQANYKNDTNTTLPAPVPPGTPTGGGLPPGPGIIPVLPPGGAPSGPPSAPASPLTGNTTGNAGGPTTYLEKDSFGKGKDAKDEAAKAKRADTAESPLGALAGEVAKQQQLGREKQAALKAAEELKMLLKEAETAEQFGWLLRPRDESKLLRDADRGLKPSASDEKTKADAEQSKPTMPPPAVPTVPVVPVPAPVTPVAPTLAQPQGIHLGSMRPQWLTAPDGSEMLVLVRTAKFDNKIVYQGVVLDWAKLQAALKEEVKDLFPDAKLVPVKDPDGVSPDRAMSVLPVQLDPGPEPVLPPAGWTPLRIGLVLAWAAAIIAVAAVGFSGWSLIDLAERRIRFVSAVTHELRTPLTSLRLYLDLLVSGMIQDEAKKQEYLNTLATESDRLQRLIDTVLDFAKLEKRRKNGDIKPVKVCDLLDQMRATWTDRVAQDGKELVVISTLPPECEVCTDSAMIQQIVSNLIDNARKYTRDAADKRIWLWAKPGLGNTVMLEVEDRGPGVAANERRTIFKPFRRGEHADSKAGGAGLGLALAKSWADVLGARLNYRPADGGTGACFRLELPGK